MHQNVPLFASQTLASYLMTRRDAMRAEIDALDRECLLSVDASVLARSLAGKHFVAPLVLGPPVIVEEGEKRVDVSRIPSRRTFGSGPRLAPVSYVVFAIPFQGDPEILRCQPLTFHLGPPRAVLTASDVRFEANSLLGGADKMRAAFDSVHDDIRKHVEWGAPQVAAFNAGLERAAAQCIESRRQKILAHASLVHGLGMPLQAAPAQPATYNVTLPRKDAPASHPLPPSGQAQPSSEPEPTLSSHVYEHILDVLLAAGVMMERAPASFASLSEPGLRDHLLVSLNTHYVGKTSAETFVGRGHTDILVSHGDHNLFIGECKIWRRPGDLTEAIGQVLRYTTWRETKAAIVLFCRATNLSTILDQIPAILQAHPGFLRQETAYRRAGATRFVLSHGGDPGRTLVVTILAFHIPLPPKNRPRPSAACDAADPGTFID